MRKGFNRADGAIGPQLPPPYAGPYAPASMPATTPSTSSAPKTQDEKKAENGWFTPAMWQQAFSSTLAIGTSLAQNKLNGNSGASAGSGGMGDSPAPEKKGIGIGGIIGITVGVAAVGTALYFIFR